MIADYYFFVVINVKCCTFFDKTLLEDIPSSPYQHGELPYVPCVFKYYGVGDVPAGFVRDLKNPQKELNKRRTQELHLRCKIMLAIWIQDGYNISKRKRSALQSVVPSTSGRPH